MKKISKILKILLNTGFVQISIIKKISKEKITITLLENIETLYISNVTLT